jgi:hypothetical protein
VLFVAVLSSELQARRAESCFVSVFYSDGLMAELQTLDEGGRLEPLLHEPPLRDELGSDARRMLCLLAVRGQYLVDSLAGSASKPEIDRDRARGRLHLVKQGLDTIAGLEAVRADDDLERLVAASCHLIELACCLDPEPESESESESESELRILNCQLSMTNHALVDYVCPAFGEIVSQQLTLRFRLARCCLRLLLLPAGQKKAAPPTAPARFACPPTKKKAPSPALARRHADGRDSFDSFYPQEYDDYLLRLV